MYDPAPTPQLVPNDKAGVSATPSQRALHAMRVAWGKRWGGYYHADKQAGRWSEAR